MPLTYQEFDTTAQMLIRDLRTKILLSTDWADVTPTPASTTLGAALAVAGLTVTVASTAAFSVGDVVVFEPGTANEERRVIATITNATTFTLGSGNGPLFAHANGTTVQSGRVVLKATTTRGAQMVVDLAGSVQTQQLTSLCPIFYRTHNGTVAGAVDPTSTRYVFFRTNATGASITMPLHVVVSASKEHLFVSIEGPRPYESGASSTTYGSLKQYFYLADLVPYHAADTVPAVVLGAGIGNSATNTVAAGGASCFVSRNAANTASWNPGRVASLSVPNAGVAEQPALRRRCTIDGNTYFFPYVFFDEVEGIRGRLNNILYAGSNAPTGPYDEPVTIGDTATYGGQTLKTVAIDKNDGGSTSDSWGSLGLVENSGANSYQSTVIGLPIA